MMYYSACKTVIQLKAARANVLLKVHPDKFGGSCEEFQNAEKEFVTKLAHLERVEIAEAREAREAKAATDARNAEALKKRNEDPLVQAAAGLSEFIALLKAKKNGV
jgi:hypothetical protein